MLCHYNLVAYPATQTEQGNGHSLPVPAYGGMKVLCRSGVWGEVVYAGSVWCV